MAQRLGRKHIGRHKLRNLPLLPAPAIPLEHMWKAIVPQDLPVAQVVASNAPFPTFWTEPPFSIKPPCGPGGSQQGTVSNLLGRACVYMWACVCTCVLARVCLCLCVWRRARAIHVETPIRAHTLECLYTRPAVTKHLDSKRCAWRMYIAIVKNYGCKKPNVCKRLPLVPWCPGALAASHACSAPRRARHPRAGPPHGGGGGPSLA